MVQTRSKGICEACGTAPATEVHHRRYKSRGGGHEVSNLFHVCGRGNHTGCHGKAHKGAEGLGWSVKSGAFAPSVIPVWYQGSWVQLDDDGSVTPVLEATALELLGLYGLDRREVA